MKTYSLALQSKKRQASFEGRATVLPLRRVLWFSSLVVLALSATGAGWVINLSRATGSDGGDAAVAGLSVVCFGHVDVEQGVTPLYPLLPGRVASVEVRESASVKAGAILLRLDDELAKLRVREAEADLAAAREQLAGARKLPEQHQAKLVQQHAAIEAVHQRLEAARSVLARKQQLEKIDQINAREVEASAALVRELEAVERAEKSKLAEMQLHDPSAGVKRAEADVNAKQARLEQARRGEAECLLKAPADGTVLRVLTSAGEVLGAQPKQPAILFCPHGPRIVRAEVEQEFASCVAVGQSAAVQDDTTAGSTWHGKLTRISDWYTHRRSVLQEPLQFNDVRTLECLITLDPGQPPLRIGQRVRVILGTTPQH
jgi:multidrug resistance efflux pump